MTIFSQTQKSLVGGGRDECAGNGTICQKKKSYFLYLSARPLNFSAPQTGWSRLSAPKQATGVRALFFPLKICSLSLTRARESSSVLACGAAEIFKLA